MLFAGCSTTLPMKVAPDLTLERFMGDWFVIAHIPTFIEDEAYNAVENYQLNPDGTIAVTFDFNQGALNGPMKSYKMTGFVNEQEPGLWGVQYIWPIKADYRVVYIDSDYQNTIVARKARDYVWLMSRTPIISEDKYNQMVEVIKSLGYDIQTLRLVPHDKSMTPERAVLLET